MRLSGQQFEENSVLFFFLSRNVVIYLGETSPLPLEKWILKIKLLFLLAAVNENFSRTNHYCIRLVTTERALI